MMQATVIGAGLAGSEAAWQLAQRGVQVTLREMKPQKMSPAHTSEYFAELVCSNSLRGAGLENAVGLLKVPTPLSEIHHELQSENKDSLYLGLIL